MEGKIILKKEIEKGAFNKGGEASSKLKSNLGKIGINPGIIRKASIVTYELEMNIIIHSEGGSITVKLNPDKISIIAGDQGPGIKNVQKAFQPGYSTAGEEIRELGFGAGMGLNNVKNNADKLEVDTELNEGTTIKVEIMI